MRSRNRVRLRPPDLAPLRLFRTLHDFNAGDRVRQSPYALNKRQNLIHHPSCPSPHAGSLRNTDISLSPTPPPSLPLSHRHPGNIPRASSCSTLRQPPYHLQGSLQHHTTAAPSNDIHNGSLQVQDSASGSTAIYTHPGESS